MESDQAEKEGENKSVNPSTLRRKGNGKPNKSNGKKSPTMGRPRVVLPDRPEEIKYETGFCPDADRAWKHFVEGRAIPHIAALMGRSNSTVHRWLIARTEHLRDMNSPEKQAQAVGLVADRYHAIWKESFDRALASDEKGQGPAWMALALKSTELLAKTYGVGGEVAEVVDLSTARRLAEVAERLRLVGMVHPAVARQLEKSALEIAEVKVDERIKLPKPETVGPPAPVIDGKFEVVS